MFYRGLFNKFARVPEINADLVPLNDPLFAILRASRIGRGLLAMNKDAEQRIYRSTHKAGLSVLFPGKMPDLGMGLSIGKYVPEYDVVALDSFFGRNAVADAKIVAHELAHRLQFITKSKSRNFDFKNAYERGLDEILIEIHADSVSALVLMQALKAFRKKSFPQDTEIMEALESAVLRLRYGKLVRNYMSGKMTDDDKMLEEMFYWRLYVDILQKDPYYRKRFFYNKIGAETHEAKATVSMALSGLLMAPMTAMGLLGGSPANISLSMAFATTLMSVFAAREWHKRGTYLYHDNSIRFAEVFAYASANMLVNEQGASHRAFAVNDNDKRCQAAAEKLVQKIDALRAER